MKRRSPLLRKGLSAEKTPEPDERSVPVLADAQSWRVHDALRESYEAVCHIVGSKRFAELAESYAEKHPLRDTNLSVAGRHFESFLKKASVTRKYPFLPELAHLEWQIVEAFSAFQAEPATPAELARLKDANTDKLRLSFQSSVSVFESRWPIFDIWQARRKPVKEITAHLRRRAQNVLVYKHGESVRVECIDGRQFLFLDWLIKGHTLGKACEKLVASYPKDTLPLAEWFAHWVRSGVFAGF